MDTGPKQVNDTQPELLAALLKCRLCFLWIEVSNKAALSSWELSNLPVERHAHIESQHRGNHGQE